MSEKSARLSLGCIALGIFFFMLAFLSNNDVKNFVYLLVVGIVFCLASLYFAVFKPRL